MSRYRASKIDCEAYHRVTHRDMQTQRRRSVRLLVSYTHRHRCRSQAEPIGELMPWNYSGRLDHQCLPDQKGLRSNKDFSVSSSHCRPPTLMAAAPAAIKTTTIQGGVRHITSIRKPVIASRKSVWVSTALVQTG